jgi:hypothetical protein
VSNERQQRPAEQLTDDKQTKRQAKPMTTDSNQTKQTTSEASQTEQTNQTETDEPAEQTNNSNNNNNNNNNNNLGCPSHWRSTRNCSLPNARKLTWGQRWIGIAGERVEIE